MYLFHLIRYTIIFSEYDLVAVTNTLRQDTVSRFCSASNFRQPLLLGLAVVILNHEPQTDENQTCGKSITTIDPPVFLATNGPILRVLCSSINPPFFVRFINVH